MASRKQPASAPEERLEANRRNLELLAAACGEEAGLHRPLNEIVGGVITGIPEETDLAQALSDRETSDLLVHLLDENRDQVEHALERIREGPYGDQDYPGHDHPASDPEPLDVAGHIAAGDVPEPLAREHPAREHHQHPDNPEPDPHAA